MGHLFRRDRFLLDEPADLQRIRARAAREVGIDVSQGADVPAAVPVAKAAKAPDNIEPLQAYVQRVQRLR